MTDPPITGVENGERKHDTQNIQTQLLPPYKYKYDYSETQKNNPSGLKQSINQEAKLFLYSQLTQVEALHQAPVEVFLKIFSYPFLGPHLSLCF